MKKLYRIILILFAIAFLFCTNSQYTMAFTEEEIAKIEKETWAITIIADVTDLYSPGIQYSFISENPIPIFKANFESDSTSDDLPIKLAASWNLIFKKVTGDKVELLPSKTKDQLTIGSNISWGKKWFITKTVSKTNGATLCWCIPIQVQIGQNI